MSEAYFIAGPNGSGKSTVIVPAAPKDIPYINADNITKSTLASNPGLQPGKEQDMAAMAQAMDSVTQAIEQGHSFIYETVMSHPSKVDFMKMATEKGFDTFLHYISTNSYEINVTRVAERVSKGGHNVPGEKVRERRSRSIDLLPKAIKSVNEAYVFDSTGQTRLVLARIFHQYGEF